MASNLLALVQQEIHYFLVILFLIFMPNLYNLSVDLSIYCSLIIPIVPAYNLRNSKGRFRAPNKEELLNQPIIQLPKEVMDPLVGNLLGDGSLQINKKGPDGKPKPTANANFSITLKNKEYIYHLWQNIYSTICTNTVPTPYPNPKKGLPVTQFKFKSRALPSLTLLHSQWYIWSDTKKGFIKRVPLNIGELLTPIGLAH